MKRGPASTRGLGVAAEPQRRNAQTQRLFDGVAGSYEGPAQVFSLFQYTGWRRFLVSRLKLAPQASVLDVCTGTGLVAIEIANTRGCPVVGVDLSGRMIEQAQGHLQSRGLARLVSLVKGRAESLPFADHSFDGVAFTFLLRYVAEPATTIRELARVLRPGGQMASLEFYVPQGLVLYLLWVLHTRLVLPLGTRLLSQGWREVGSFLGPNIAAFYREHTLQDLKEMWERAGICDVQARVLSMGGAVVMWGRKEADGED